MTEPVVLDVESLTRRECQRIIREVKQINTLARYDIRDEMAHNVKAILRDIVKQRGNPGV